MVGEGTGIRLGHREFWNCPLLNVEQCGDMINNWLDMQGRGEPFYDINEARPGDAIAFSGGKYDAWTFAIFISPGRMASTVKVKNCKGVVSPKLMILRMTGMDVQSRYFAGGIHIERRDIS